MEYSRKLILVPEDRVEVADQLTDLDNKMQEIIRTKGLPEREKMNQYLQVLQKFVKIHHPRQERTEEDSEKEEDVKSDSEKEDSITTKILKAAPVRYLNTARNILDFIKEKPSVLSWTPDGEIVYKGKHLHRTNIVKLVVDLLRNRKQSPAGSKEFHLALKEMNVPASYIMNKKIFQTNSILEHKKSKRIAFVRGDAITEKFPTQCKQYPANPKKALTSDLCFCGRREKIENGLHFDLRGSPDLTAYSMPQVHSAVPGKFALRRLYCQICVLKLHRCVLNDPPNYLDGWGLNGRMASALAFGTTGIGFKSRRCHGCLE
ncbi:uncharacterized protein CDAR_251131 [Caerostris darwini]|uniref:Uncharacterized protein n=1 Tax=Caerostris darwini TaxID=1538125 RepID=A0AAV4NCC2_9ARAC|nr:uncharacterized protein CDAR_251131 [Caerostris darwini]